MIRPLRERLASIDECFRDKADIESHTYYCTLIEAVISKGFERSQPIKCLGRGKQGNFKRNSNKCQANSESRSEPLEYAEGVIKLGMD